MKKESSYLSERIYDRENSYLTDEDNSRYKYWRKMLGERVFEYMLAKNEKFNCFLLGRDFRISNMEISEGLLQYLIISDYNPVDVKIDQLYMEQVFFGQFYRKILQYYKNKLRKMLQGKEACFTEKIYTDFSYHLVNELQNICIRTLIAQMHVRKRENKLGGVTKEEQYQYYCNECIDKPLFYQQMFDEYPVLYRCISEKAEQLVYYYTEVVNHFYEERSLLGEKITGGLCPTKIIGITSGFSDCHNKGKQVLRIQFDIEKTVLYKPHSMDNEIVYYKLLSWIGERIGITQLRYSFISKKDHSWSECVCYKTCKTEEQLKKYYKRLGVQLFLTSFLGTKDLHYENIIASGEYPVLVDLEVLVNLTNNEERKTASQEIYYQLSNSVLYTGLLPLYYWNGNGNGINISGISGAGGQRYPFKTPAIVNGGTSEMKVEYRYPTSKDADNLATLNGIFQNPSMYKQEIMDGFSKAYHKILEDKEQFAAEICCLSKIKNRFLATDTQRYSMMISASYHPDLLRNGADRETFFYGMWKGRENGYEVIVNEEVRSMLQGDIPYFFNCADQLALCSEAGILKPAFFLNTIQDQIIEKLNFLCEKDLLRQMEYIELSLNFIPDKKAAFQNKVYYVPTKVENDTNDKVDQEMYTPDDLISRVLDHAVWNYDLTEVNWEIVQLAVTGKETWEIRAMNHYLYDGLAGMLLLFYELYSKKSNSLIMKVYETLKNMLFLYTDKGYEDCANLDSQNTGAYEGESSIIYTYLILYRLNNEKQFLDYAKKHADIVARLIDTDRKYDLLSGNAGAAWILILLYQVTEDKKYLRCSAEAVNVLAEFAEKQQIGVGWTVEKGISPMSGAAHGNSGILMPILALWKYTGEEKYQNLAEQIWSYEDSLYLSEINNWADTRNDAESADAVGNVAWCHGAAGILYTRMICYELMEENKWRTRLKQDIQRAYSKLKYYWKRDSYCLCHGTFGNSWILDLTEKEMTKYGITEIVQRKTGDAVNFKNRITLLPQEQMNPGLLNGYGGILYYLIVDDTLKV